MKVLLLFNIFDTDEPVPGAGPITAASREKLILLGALFFVIAAIVCWAAFFRKRDRHRSAHHERPRPHRSVGHRTRAGIAGLRQLFGEKQQRRRAHRPRNPTLAETGGLPPARPNLEIPDK